MKRHAPSLVPAGSGSTTPGAVAERLGSRASEEEMLLVRRAASGERDAFSALMRRHNRRLYRLARATLRDEAEAEDALQEAYLSAYCGIDRFRGESTLATWLSRLVINECLGRLRKGARRSAVAPTAASDAMDEAPSDAHEGPHDALERSEMRRLLERKLDALPEDFRTVFVLRSVEELSVEETAAALGIPQATVRSRHFRARTLLRESLAGDIDVASRDVFDFGGRQCDRIVAAVNARLD